MRVLSRTGTYAAALFRNPDRRAEPRAAFRKISEMCNLTYFTVSFVVLQCDQHMVPQNIAFSTLRGEVHTIRDQAL